jgi:hypothetical protein
VNVLLFGIAGVLGLAFLLQTLHRLTLLDIPESTSAPAAAAPPSPPAVVPAEPSGALSRVTGSVLGANVKAVFFCWVVVFGLVGAQMSWILRPFIGNPEQPFEWFRTRDSNFFHAVGRALLDLFW